MEEGGKKSGAGAWNCDGSPCARVCMCVVPVQVGGFDVHGEQHVWVCCEPNNAL